jgi:predicted metalloprotease with PDZ domain
MNEVTPYDWRTFFNTRLHSTEPHAPMGGLANGGWRMVFSDVQSDYQKALEEANKMVDLSYSIGIKVGEDNIIGDAIPGTPGYLAGLGPGMKIVGVNGRVFSLEALREAVRAAKSSTAPIELLAQNGGSLRRYSIQYHNGERFPHLERDMAHPDLLQEIIKPLAPRK